MADSQSYSSRLSDDGSLVAMWREHRLEGIANCGGQEGFWQKASRLKRFAARDQWPDKDKQKLDNPDRKSARLTIPETSRVLAAFSGRQVLSRMERGYIPYNQDSSRHAEIWTKVDRALCQACDGEQTDSAAFRDGPGIQGVSWVRWYVDDWSAEKPQLKYETIPIWQMMWPPTRKLNLQDRPWQRWGSWWPQSTVRARWPKEYDKIKMLIGTRQWTDIQQSANQSSRIPWTGGAGNRPYNAADAYDPKTRSFWIEYEEWRELVTYFQVARPALQMSYDEAMEVNAERVGLLADPATASNAPPDPMEVVEMSSDQLKQYRKERLAVFGEDVPNDAIARKQRMVYRYAYGCGDEILETDDLETKCFTFQAMAAEVVELEDKTLYIGLLEDLEDAQKMVNFMMSALIRDLQINPKGVLFIEQGLFRDRNDALTAFTAPGGVVEIPRGRMVGAQGQRPWEFVSGGTNNYSSKLENMLAFYREAIPRLAGFNPAALGQLGTDIRRVSGEVVRQLTDATMTSNAERMDSYRLYRREGARILLAFARILWEPEDLVRYIGESDAYDDVLDPATGLPTGEKVLAIPPKEMWKEDAWKEIAIEEVQPSDSELSAFWDTVQTQVQLLQSPMPDTGKPLFEAIDWVQLFPKMPAALRQKMIARIKMQQKAFQLQQQQQQQMQMQQQAGMQQPTEGEQPTGELPV